MIYLFRAMTAAEAAAQKRSGASPHQPANAIFRGLRPLSSAYAPEVLCVRTT